MNQRLFLALILTALVLVATPYFFPGPKAALKPGTDWLALHTTGAKAQPTAGAAANTVSSSRPVIGSQAQLKQPQGDTVQAHASKSRYVFSTTGAAPVQVVLDSYPSRRPGFRNTPSRLVEPGHSLLHFTLLTPKDTVHLDTVAFVKDPTSTASTLSFSATAAGYPVVVRYQLPSGREDDYLIHSSISVANAPAGSLVYMQLADNLSPNEPDTLDELSHLAVSFRPARGDVQSVNFSKLDTTAARIEPGPINWVAIRNKYFLLAVRGTSSPFNGVSLLGGSRTGKVAATATTLLVTPLRNGSATFDVYAGPQDFEQLQHLGGDLDQVNPYAGLLHGVIQPVATIVMKVLLWMKRTTRLNYGWVLVLFGISIRLLLWPLNQSAMRTSIKMQRLQPEIQALQKKHGDDPRKQQEAIMKVYKDHGMSPLSPIMGCLPMLLPMPVLFALYFVFNNTIEFRGVSFLWLPDISLRDPYYITPLVMGASMFLMSWIGMRSAPPNPQAKMMSYMMPVMMTVFFLNFASGLNLYYAVQNVAAIPQQWFIARERGRSAPVILTNMPPAGRKRPA